MDEHSAGGATGTVDVEFLGLREDDLVTGAAPVVALDGVVPAVETGPLRLRRSGALSGARSGAGARDAHAPTAAPVLPGESGVPDGGRAGVLLDPALDPALEPAPAPTRAAAPRSRGRRVRGTWWVFATGLLVGAVASAWGLRAGWLMDYGDAMAHLTIARRILDSRSPGISQLGTVWLPVPHLVLLPFVQSLWLFHTGLAGSIVNTLCLASTATAVFRIGAHLGLGLPARLAAVAVVLTNVSLLYVATTALTEPLLLALMTGAVAGATGWVFSERKLSGGELTVFCGVPLGLSVLTRYEAWPLALACGIYVAIVVLRRGDGWGRAVRLTLGLATPSLLGIAWWLAYNQAVYGSPLEFLTGEYSASAFADTYAARGQLTTAGHLGLSLRVMWAALTDTVGLVPLVLAGAGLALLTWRRGLDDRALALWVLGAPTVFLTFSLFAGQHVMFNDASIPTGAYNNRYVLSAVPWVACLVAYLVDVVSMPVLPGRLATLTTRVLGPVRLRGAVVAGLVAVGLVGQVLWWAGDPYGRMVVVEEGHLQAVDYVDRKAAATWLGEHYDGGDILMDESATLVAPVIGLPQRDFWNRATGDLFDEALADPYDHARWVWVRVDLTADELSNSSSADRVAAAVAADPALLSRYVVAYVNEDVAIYRRIGDPS
ncbi:hypothetical protein [Nocardioides sp. GY 10127]|uniref:ArnT family glycosyltransferase n=1 Tax=Nocardioides sp. GY 10127 TaxID=2569762 RepID=UPI0010A8B473|nr:hypothetical protein [Nocardioides sp. GY 10127]TIC79428.1 hypothetical protein E8D37_17810 [Nocardioides sp. GY 10127]